MRSRSYYRLVGGIASIVAGVIVAVVGYLGVSRELEVAFQLPYFASAGIGALLLFGAGATLLLGVQLERDAERLEDLEQAVRLLAAEVGRLADDAPPARDGTTNGDGATRTTPPSTTTRRDVSAATPGASGHR